jgi:hypothetical protein
MFKHACGLGCEGFAQSNPRSVGFPPGLNFHFEWGSSAQTNADIWINMHSHREAVR